MELQSLLDFCLALPGCTQDIKWGQDLCLSVGAKMFLCLGPDNHPVTASFKVEPEEFEELCLREGFRPAPYLAKHHWVHLDDINRLNMKDWKIRMAASYQLVFDKLPKKMQRSILSGAD
jgi:predicted DNA-binding protein (MmcQ/YjbR family)